MQSFYRKEGNSRLRKVSNLSWMYQDVNTVLVNIQDSLSNAALLLITNIAIAI